MIKLKDLAKETTYIVTSSTIGFFGLPYISSFFSDVQYDTIHDENAFTAPVGITILAGLSYIVLKKTFGKKE